MAEHLESLLTLLYSVCVCVVVVVVGGWGGGSRARVVRVCVRRNDSL